MSESRYCPQCGHAVSEIPNTGGVVVQYFCIRCYKILFNTLSYEARFSILYGLISPYRQATGVIKRTNLRYTENIAK